MASNDFRAIKPTPAVDDFWKGPLADLGVEVTRTPVLTTTDFEGNKTYADTPTEILFVVFENPNQNFNLAKPGLTEVYDARMFIYPTQKINKYDKITYDSKVYRVKTISIKRFNGTKMFKTVTLTYIEDE